MVSVEIIENGTKYRISNSELNTVYNSGNPNPSGWTWAGLEADFGFASNKMRLNADNASVRADIEDAIEEGIVIIGSAGNNNFHMVADGDPDYDNRVSVSGLGTVFYNRGSTPANSLNAINVGSLSSYVNFRRSTYSNFGPLVDVFAPGDNIISAYNSIYRQSIKKLMSYHYSFNR